MLGSQEFPRLLERPSEYISKPCPQDLYNQHRLPVWDGESASVAIKDNHTRVYLRAVSFFVDTGAKGMFEENVRRSERRHKAMQ